MCDANMRSAVASGRTVRLFICDINDSFSFSPCFFSVCVRSAEIIYYIAYNSIRIIYHPIVSFAYGKFRRSILKSVWINCICIKVRCIKFVFMPRNVRKDHRIIDLFPLRQQLFHYSANHTIELSVIAYIECDFFRFCQHFLYLHFNFRSYI